MSHPENDDMARQKLREMIKDIRVAMMVTSTEEGHLRSRPMYVQQLDEDGRTAWLFTKAHAAKNEEIAEDSEVLLAFADRACNDYASVRGKARIVHDVAKQKALWSEWARTWFPNGAEDPALRLIAVRLEGGEYWDSVSSTVLHAYGYLQALATGKQPDAGEHAKVSFAG